MTRKTKTNIKYTNKERLEVIMEMFEKVDALRERGVIVGLGLTVWRILRCNPFCKAGYDPVPPKKSKTKIITVEQIIQKGEI